MSANNLKAKFEQEIKNATPPPAPKKERVWTPIDNADNTKYHSQTKVKKTVPKPDGPPPPKKSITDLP
jgi:hypothetical protein